jgi:ComF family protein
MAQLAVARALLGRLGIGALNLLLPPRCLACGAVVDAAGGLCGPCWARLVFLGPPWCRVCGHPLPHAVSDAPLCARCAAEAPRWERARAALRYDDGCRRMVLGLKYYDRTDATPAFGRWLTAAGRELLDEADLLVPVPLHRRRLLARGYNQAGLLAQAVARVAGVPVVPDLLRRVRPTAPQQGLGPEARRDNVRAAAFRVNAWQAARLEGRRVVLVDDVLTTGATVDACVQVLHRGGAAGVDVLTLARVVRAERVPIS